MHKIKVPNQEQSFVGKKAGGPPANECPLQNPMFCEIICRHMPEMPCAKVEKKMLFLIKFKIE